GAFRATIAGVAAGTVLAAAVIFAIVRGAPPVIPFVAELRLGPADWAALALVPVGALLLGCWSRGGRPTGWRAGCHERRAGQADRRVSLSRVPGRLRGNPAD